ncbi:cytochrome P450 [Gigaspora margarita]|uniref:Cytochrome P450 n=1 Tax=Gigaspora margarita TaxID=4874 RepID=A0A8H3X714_GIGMA|nr:cytochrome P450 [Gigaspora margarita]
MIIKEIIDPINLTKLFLTITFIYVLNFYYRYFTRPNPLPGPFPLPFIGNLHNHGLDTNGYYEYCLKKYGDISEVYLDHRYIILSRPEHIKKLFAPSEFFMHQPYSQGCDEVGIEGVGLFFNGNNKSWSFNRHFFNEALSRKLIDSTIETINQLYDEMSGYWQSLGNQSSSNNSNNWTIETDFSSWFHGFTNEVTSTLTTGQRTYSIASYYNTQSNIKSIHSNALVENGNKFTKALVKFMECLPFFTFLSPFMRHYFPIIKGQANSYLNNRDLLFKNLDEMIKNRRNEIEKMQGAEMKSDMLTSLLTAKTVVEGDNFRPMPDKEIRGNLIDIFLGGSDTTASLFCYITYYVCKNPEVKQKMLSEIDSVLPNFSDKLYKQEDLKQLKYCNAIIFEAARLMPPIAIALRHITKEFEIAGYKWPAGTNFHLNIKGAQRHPEFWNNPEVFNPDRFYNNENDTSSIIIWGGGKRICPGRSLSIVESLLFIALVYKNYNVELVNPNDPLKFFSGMVISSTELKVRISPRT